MTLSELLVIMLFRKTAITRLYTKRKEACHSYRDY